jgi:hypothetical protein
VRAERERGREGLAEGASEQGKVGERGTGRGRADVAKDRTVVGASTVGDHGREVGDELTGGVSRTERGGARARGTTPINLAHGAAREREGERGRAGWHRQAGPACQTPRARGRGRARG